MVIRKTTHKLDDYFARLGQPDARRVKPAHVAKILGKLRRKEADLLEEIEGTDKPERAERMRAKLEIVREQIRRGAALMEQLDAQDQGRAAKSFGRSSRRQ